MRIYASRDTSSSSTSLTSFLTAAYTSSSSHLGGPVFISNISSKSPTCLLSLISLSCLPPRRCPSFNLMAFWDSRMFCILTACWAFGARYRGKGVAPVEGEGVP